MKITSVELKISAVRRSQYPTDEKSEYLLVGKSNVGKSSFINTLINRKNFARTSATPGKTQTINFTVEDLAKHIELYGITKIGLDAFKYNKVESIKLPDGLKSIEDFAFKNCNNIKDISIPEGVTQIGNYAFSNCHSLCSIKLPSTLESLGYYSFCDCVALSSINLPKTIKTIGYYAFSNTNIQNIDETFFGQMNGYDSKFEGMLTIKGGLALSGSKVLYSTKHASSLEIPEGIEELSFNAFHYNHALKSVRLPKSLKVIGRQAFCGCENLSEICFDGSEKDWDKVKKEQWWCAEVAATSVKCKTLFGTKEVELKL